MLNRGRTLSALAAACLLTSGIVASVPAAAATLNELATASRFIVHSRVSKVEYAQSEAAKGQPGVPHTIVTFDVVKPLQGNVGAASFTLRFIGGPDGRGRFMQASNVPVFQLGDEDILFVQGNGSKGCALAGCADGRFRVLNGLVYDGTGTPVLRVESGRVVASGETPAELSTIRFPRPSFDALMKNAEARQAIASQGLSATEARQRYEAQAPAMIEMSAINGGRSGSDRGGHGTGQESGTAAPITGRTMSADSFVSKLAGLSVARAEGSPAFESIDAQARIAAPSTQAAIPPKVRADRAGSTRSAAEEAAAITQLKQQ
ncbi:MAG TPA: hypothetical protein VFY73_21260 [Ideonella sp.]|uniref:hypothetical protein n=1 Tax=Ideonella sp. TaxID=1929293 RepID=UPI002E2FC1AB|nr:hypothetical protein [Ideonella sp.]HEX5686563.1 hypothetical protein [Ideonella sp.]